MVLTTGNARKRRRYKFVKTKNPNPNIKIGIWNFKNFNISKKDYFPLFASAIYFSKAIVIEGVSGVGARISILKP